MSMSLLLHFSNNVICIARGPRVAQRHSSISDILVSVDTCSL